MKGDQHDRKRRLFGLTMPPVCGEREACRGERQRNRLNELPRFYSTWWRGLLKSQRTAENATCAFFNVFRRLHHFHPPLSPSLHHTRSALYTLKSHSHTIQQLWHCTKHSPPLHSVQPTLSLAHLLLFPKFVHESN